MSAMNDKDYVLEVLKKSSIITDKQLDEAATQARAKSTTVLKALKDLGHVDGRKVAQTVAESFGMDWLNLAEEDIPRETLDKVPPDVARRYKIIPVTANDNSLVVAMSDPMNLDVIDKHRHVQKMDIETIVSDEEYIADAIDS